MQLRSAPESIKAMTSNSKSLLMTILTLDFTYILHDCDIFFNNNNFCVCCEGGDYSTNAQCPVLALVVPWPYYKLIDAYLHVNAYLILLLWKMHAA